MRFVENTFPHNMQSQLERDVELSIRFFLDVDENTIDDRTVILMDLVEQTPVSCSRVYKRRILTIKPIESLRPNNHYQLLIKGGTSGIKDIIGLEMAESYELEFYTKAIESIKPPAIMKPVNRTITESPFEIELSPAVNAMYYEVQLSKSNRFDKVIWPQNNHLIAQATEIKFKPDVVLSSGNYYLRARSMSDDGQASEYGPISQIYIDVPEIEEEVVEEVKTPSITLGGKTSFTQDIDVINHLLVDEVVEAIPNFFMLSSTPRKDEVHVPIAELKNIVIRLSENINPESINTKSIYVIKERN